VCTTRCPPRSSCPPATRIRNEKVRPHPSRPPETAQDRWTGCPRGFCLHFGPCLHPQTGPVAQSSTNDILTRGQEGAGKRGKWGKESAGVCASHHAVHSVLRIPAGALINSSVMAAAKATGWCGRGRRHAHHERRRHFLWSKAVRILSGDRRSGSARFLFSLINISTIGPVPSESTG
jgi:hypothetical protein